MNNVKDHMGLLVATHTHTHTLASFSGHHPDFVVCSRARGESLGTRLAYWNNTSNVTLYMKAITYVHTHAQTWDHVKTIALFLTTEGARERG